MVDKDWVRSYAMMTRAAAGDVAAAKAGLAQLDQYIPLEQRQRGLKLAQIFDNAVDRGIDPVGTPVAVAKVAPVAPSRVVTKPAVIKPDVYKPPVVTAAAPPPRPAVGGNWRVQLGAFGNAAGASALWGKLQGRISALGPYQSFIVPAGAVTRLQAGPLPNRPAADKLCLAVKASGNACLIVAP